MRVFETKPDDFDIFPDDSDVPCGRIYKQVDGWWSPMIINNGTDTAFSIDRYSEFDFALRAIEDYYAEVPTPKRFKRGERLYNDATNTINGERQDQYGSPEDSFKLIATRWSQYLRCRYGLTAELNPRDVAFMMSDFKHARECASPKRDNILDAVGYLGILDDLK